jgi:hypothetical protein
MNIFNDILSHLLDFYMTQSPEQLIQIQEKGIIKEEIDRVRDMRVIIYPNDHNPPHFHVKSKNGDVDAKFRIDNGEYISGLISGKDLKRIDAFYNSDKAQIILKDVWNRYQGTTL